MTPASIAAEIRRATRAIIIISGAFASAQAAAWARTGATVAHRREIMAGRRTIAIAVRIADTVGQLSTTTWAIQDTAVAA